MRNLIKLILEDEVNRKYEKPTPKIDQLVYRWLNDYFDGAQMYYNKSWETRHDFEWCNNGKEIMSLIIFFEDNSVDYYDRRKTEERYFDSGFLYVPNDIFKELMSDIPVRASYLKYLFEEWFDDTYLGEIQKVMRRNDIYISEFNIEGNVKTCVPPVTKPENVTEEEMIELILKTTLFRMDGILKNEEESPGWIEKTYLEKLRSAEDDRLRGY
jgi:hypothetical protein